MTKEENKERKKQIKIENKERRLTKMPKHIKKRAEKRNKK
jgi:RIO kinase 1